MGQHRYVETVVSGKDGSLVEKEFDMDEGMHHAILTLSEEERLLYFTEGYREYRKERKRRERYYGGSLVEEDEFLELVHEIPDFSEAPDQYTERKMKEECLEKGLRKLTPLQAKVISAIYYHERKQEDIAIELGVTQQAVAQILGRSLAKLRKEFPKDF